MSDKVNVRMSFSGPFTREDCNRMLSLFTEINGEHPDEDHFLAFLDLPDSTSEAAATFLAEHFPFVTVLFKKH